MGIFGFSFHKQKPLPWPSDENGGLVSPTLLKTVLYDDMEVEITLNMLSAYGIPSDKRWRRKTRDVDIFVPETMLSEARELLDAEIVPEDAEL